MTTPNRSGGFDRIRPRTPAADTTTVRPRDAEGKRALFSAPEGEGALPGAGSFRVAGPRRGFVQRRVPAVRRAHGAVADGCGPRGVSVAAAVRRRRSR